MSVSQGNKKIGSIPNWSIIPVRDCPNCKACKHTYYALKAWKQYPGVRKSWTENSKLAHKLDLSPVVEYLAKRSPKWFRVHVAGDFFSREYLMLWIDIAKRFPGTRFLAFTKAFDIVNGAQVPPNFQLILSAWKGQCPDGVGPVAYAGESSDYDGKHGNRASKAILCPGSCEGCMVCWSLGKAGRDVRFELH